MPSHKIVLGPEFHFPMWLRFCLVAKLVGAVDKCRIKLKAMDGREALVKAFDKIFINGCLDQTSANFCIGAPSHAH